VRIAIVGWIYEAPPEVRALQLWSPERSLASALRHQGHEVSEFGHLHFDGGTAKGADVIHVHFLGPGCTTAWRRVLTSRASLVFTKHLLEGPTVRQRAALLMTGALSRGIITLGPNEKEAWPRVLHRRLAAIPNAINVGPFWAVRHRRRLERPVRLLFAGSLLRVKRIDVIIRALADLHGRGVPATLTITSHRPTDADALRSLAERLDVSADIEWATARTPEELADMYARAHLLVLASRAEGRPSVVAEGIITGLPVVSTAVGDVEDQVGTAGVMVEHPATAGGLATAIEHAIASYSSLADRAFEMGTTMAVECAPETVARRHVEVYQGRSGAT
jgi:glycosyltransferase involved in cell wall biosynthesis